MAVGGHRSPRRMSLPMRHVRAVGVHAPFGKGATVNVRLRSPEDDCLVDRLESSDEAAGGGVGVVELVEARIGAQPLDEHIAQALRSSTASRPRCALM